MSFEFNYSSPFGPAFRPEPGTGLLVTILIITLIIPLIYAVVGYVFRSISLYQIAKRRRVHHAWLSWIPVGNAWILGSIADQYQYVVRNRICNRRKILLWMTLAAEILSVLQLVLGIVVTGRMAVASSVSDALLVRMFGPGAAVSLVEFLALAAGVTAAVFQYIALYDLFTSCNPDTRVVFLVLGILFGFLLPFFLFADRKKDNGMPPRIDEIPNEIPSCGNEPDFE